MESDVRVIKRYANRKLYDTSLSSYVTLEEIAQTIRENENIVVINNNTKEDITYKTLIQLLHDMERKAVVNKDCDLLSRVIKSDEGTFTGHIKRLEALISNSDQDVSTLAPLVEEQPEVETAATVQ